MGKSTFQVREPIASYPRVRVLGDGRHVVSQAGSVLLVETARKTGLDQAVSAALTPWRRLRAVHDSEGASTGRSDGTRHPPETTHGF